MPLVQQPYPVYHASVPLSVHRQFETDNTARQSGTICQTVPEEQQPRPAREVQVNSSEQSSVAEALLCLSAAV